MGKIKLSSAERGGTGNVRWLACPTVRGVGNNGPCKIIYAIHSSLPLIAQNQRVLSNILEVLNFSFSVQTALRVGQRTQACVLALSRKRPAAGGPADTKPQTSSPLPPASVRKAKGRAFSGN